MKLYEIDDKYIDYLRRYDSKVLSPKLTERKFSRKYLGVVLSVNGLDYFVPLSSYKSKHDRMKNSVDFIKIKDNKRKYAVLNINNMIPVVPSVLIPFDIRQEADIKYRSLMVSEFIAISKLEESIKKKAANFYKLVVFDKIDRYIQRSCDFTRLEAAAKEYHQ